MAVKAMAECVFNYLLLGTVWTAALENLTIPIQWGSSLVTPQIIARAPARYAARQTAHLL